VPQRNSAGWDDLGLLALAVNLLIFISQNLAKWTDRADNKAEPHEILKVLRQFSFTAILALLWLTYVFIAFGQQESLLHAWTRNAFLLAASVYTLIWLSEYMGGRQVRAEA